MVPEQFFREIEERQAEFAASALEIIGPAPRQVEFIDRICRTYLRADAPGRSALASRLSDKNGILNCLLGNAYRCAEMLKATQDAEWLREGLAAARLAQRGTDYRDVLLALAELYVVAEEAGIAPGAAFLEICNLPDFGAAAAVASRRSGTHRVVE